MTGSGTGGDRWGTAPRRLGRGKQAPEVVATRHYSFALRIQVSTDQEGAVTDWHISLVEASSGARLHFGTLEGLTAHLARCIDPRGAASSSP
jgi:hypothetical protein